jgi:hypothetical protein
VHPDIPTPFPLHRPSGRKVISAQVAVGLLRGDQTLNDAVYFRFEFGIARVEPSEDSRMQPFADMLANPRLRPWALAEAAEQGVFVQRQQPPLFIGGEAVTQ